MATRIHPSACVETGAELGLDVEIGPFAYVGAKVRLGDGTRLHHHATVEGYTSLGAGNEVFPYACLGGKTQDLKYRGGNPGLRIGDRNVFREYVSVHMGTNDGEFTIVGSDNNLLAYTHVAHDCILGDRIIASNYAGLAGHVVIGNHVVIGGFGGIHQFCRIGDYAMVGGAAKVVQDVPPYMIADGGPAVARAYNKVGLERAGFDAARLERVKVIFRTLYREGLNRSQALEKLNAHPEASSAEFRCFLEFAAKSERGMIPGA